jgi:hypothetical protein
MIVLQSIAFVGAAMCGAGIVIGFLALMIYVYSRDA